MWIIIDNINYNNNSNNKPKRETELLLKAAQNNAIRNIYIKMKIDYT